MIGDNLINVLIDQDIGILWATFFVISRFLAHTKLQSYSLKISNVVSVVITILKYIYDMENNKPRSKKTILFHFALSCLDLYKDHIDFNNTGLSYNNYTLLTHAFSFLQDIYEMIKRCDESSNNRHSTSNTTSRSTSEHNV